MATQVQFRGGTTTEHASFTGAAREVTVDTTKDTVVVHDGSTAGGIPLAKENSPTFTGTVTGPTINASTALQIGGTAVTSTAAELNILDGVTSTATELNLLDGVTSTTAELNILDGVTSTTAELNYTDGVTSNIQTQLNTKAPTASPTFTGTVAIPNVANLETAVVANTAKVTNATHTGDVTGGTALTIANDAVTGAKIADDTITEANLDISNAPTNDYVLTADSGQGGGLKWAAAATGGLSNNSSKTNSLGVGDNALDSETSGADYNTGLGKSALTAVSNTTANTGVGYEAGASITSGYANTALGAEALPYNQTGASNVAIGHQSCGRGGSATEIKFNTAVGSHALNACGGDYNTALGWESLKNTSTGDYNTACGTQALRQNQGGSYNTALGYKALYTPTAKDNNTAIGGFTLYLNSTGGENTALGYQACESNTTGSKVVGLGYGALKNNQQGSELVGVGYLACGGNGSGRSFYQNTAVGNQALKDVTGSSNTAVGYNAGNVHTTGNITAVGASAGLANTSGIIVAIGHEALTKNTTGIHNTAVGLSALYENETGHSNTAVGFHALDSSTGDENSGFGHYALAGVTTGSGNTGLGKYAGDLTTTGSNNTCIGFESDPSSNSASNEIILGNSSVQHLRCASQSISGLSDARDKTEVEPSPLGVDFLNTLNPVKFKWDSREGLSKDGTYEIGFIAQELQAVQKESNTEYLKMVLDTNPDRLEASYGQLVPILVQAIKELSAQVKELQQT